MIWRSLQNVIRRALSGVSEPMDRDWMESFGIFLSTSRSNLALTIVSSWSHRYGLGTFTNSTQFHIWTLAPSLIFGVFLLSAIAFLQASMRDCAFWCFGVHLGKKLSYCGNAVLIGVAVTSCSRYESVDAMIIFPSRSSIWTPARDGCLLSDEQNSNALSRSDLLIIILKRNIIKANLFCLASSW